jgi:hypothetical protein
VKGFHVIREFSAQFVSTGHQRFEMIAVPDPRRFCDLLDAFALKACQVCPEDRVTAERRKLGGCLGFQRSWRNLPAPGRRCFPKRFTSIFFFSIR